MRRVLPMVLMRPRVGEDWLSFSNIGDTIREGYRSAHKALEDFELYAQQAGGVYPRRRFELAHQAGSWRPRGAASNSPRANSREMHCASPRMPRS